MKGTKWALLLIVVFGSSALALGDEEFDALMSSYDQKLAEWYERLAEAQNEDGTYDAAKISAHPAEECLESFKAYSKKHAGASKAIPALAWIANVGAKNVRTDEGLTAGRSALGELTERHAADGVIGEVIADLVFAWGHVGWEPMRSFYKRVLAVNKDERALSWACFGLGFLIYNENLDPQREEPVDLDEARELFGRTVKDYDGSRAAEWASFSILTALPACGGRAAFPTRGAGSTIR